MPTEGWLQRLSRGSGGAEAHRYRFLKPRVHQEVLALDAADPESYAVRGLAYYALGDFPSAHASCQTKPGYRENQQCLAVTYDKRGRHADLEAQLARIKAQLGKLERWSSAHG